MNQPPVPLDDLAAALDLAHAAAAAIVNWRARSADVALLVRVVRELGARLAAAP